MAKNLLLIYSEKLAVYNPLAQLFTILLLTEDVRPYGRDILDKNEAAGASPRPTLYGYLFSAFIADPCPYSKSSDKDITHCSYSF